jgi:hypothetical protein
MLGAMLAWIAAAALAAWGGARVFLGYPRPDPATHCLSRREMATLAAAADALFPPGGAIECSGSDAGIPRYLDRLVAASHAKNRLLMRLLFFLVEHATLLFPAPGVLAGRRRFSSLDGEARVAALEGWRRSRWFARRVVFTSLRALFTLGYFAHPPVLRALRLAPHAIATPVCEADLLYPAIGAHPDAIPLGRDDLTPPSGGEPLAPDTPLAPGYAEDPA